MKDIKDLEGLEIFLGYKCNVKCEFCFQKNIRKDFKDSFSKDVVVSLINDGYEKGKRFIIFSGGEPTLDSNLSFYIEYSKNLGFIHIRIHSNGFRLKEYEYLKQLYGRGLTGVTISVHGYGKCHDNITGVKGSFITIKKALDNLEKITNIDNNFVVDINTVIYKGNYNKLLKLFLFLFNYKVIRYQINYSSSLDMFDISEKKELLINYGLITIELKKIFLFSLKKNKKIVIDSIPYCIIGKSYFSFIDNNIKNDRESFTVSGDNEKTYDETYSNIKPKKCINCSIFMKCRGVPVDYYEVFGDYEIKPFLGKKIF